MKNLFYYPRERKVFCEILFVLVDDCPVIISYPHCTYSQNFLPGTMELVARAQFIRESRNKLRYRPLAHLKYEFKIWIPFKEWINLSYNRPNINYQWILHVVHVVHINLFFFFSLSLSLSLPLFE